MTPALLDVRGLSFAWGLGSGVFDVDLSVRVGEIAALVGESGSGKSTLARIIAGLEQPKSGDVLLDGVPWVPAGAAGRHGVVQMVFQDPRDSLDPRLNIGDAIADVLRFVEPTLKSAERRQRAVRALQEVGLSEAFFYRRARDLSGGQCQRAAIARALVARPKLLICDEAASALDVSTQAQVINLIKDVRDHYGMAVLFIAHDLGMTRHICDRIAVMWKGRIVEQGERDRVYATPTHPYTSKLLAAARGVSIP